MYVKSLREDAFSGEDAVSDDIGDSHEELAKDGALMVRDIDDGVDVSRESPKLSREGRHIEGGDVSRGASCR